MSGGCTLAAGGRRAEVTSSRRHTIGLLIAF